MTNITSLRCDDCGRFMALRLGASSATVHCGGLRNVTRLWVRCPHCSRRLGPVRSTVSASHESIWPDDYRSPSHA